MKCGIHNCTQGDNRFLWHCHGTCGRSFHAACIGAQRNNEEVLRTFMLPLCHDCQERFTTELNLKVLSTSLRQIDSSIGRTLESNHKLISNYSSLSASHDEAMDSIEKSLHNFNRRLENIETICKNKIAEVKDAVTALSDTPPETSIAMESIAKSAIAAVAEINTTAATVAADTAETIERLPQIISSLKNELGDSHSSLMQQVKVHFEDMQKSLSVYQSDKNTHAFCKCDSLAKELEKPVELCNNWRWIGTKKIWKRDWTEFDARQHARRLQEKEHDKARRRRKQKRRRQQRNNNNTNNKNSSKNNTSDNTSTTNPINNTSNVFNGTQNRQRIVASDKELLATARVQFSGPPSTIDHPIAALSVPKFTNFRKGETINPYRTQHQTPQNSTSTSQPENAAPPKEVIHGWTLDPMRPPIVSMTQQSADGDGRFLKARLRDPKIMYIVRLYLAYLHDKEPSFCHEGMTCTSVKMNLASEGLPTSVAELRKIFFAVHHEYDVAEKEAADDLDAYRRHLQNQRIQHLQRTRESTDKFHIPSFRK